MSLIDTKGDYFIITVGKSEKAVQEEQGLIDTNNEIINFIIESAKQMTSFVQTDHNESRILRTPSRRTSKRRMSSIASSTNKKGQPSALKVKDVSAATPKRFSKRMKRSTIKMNSTIEQMEVQEVVTQTSESTVIYTQEINTIKETINGHNSAENMDVVVENKETIDDKIEITNEVNVNDVLVIDNVMTASELMSELSIREDEQKVDNKLNESENDWMTDDEECPQKNDNNSEQFFDAINDKSLITVKEKGIKNVSNNSLVNKSLKTRSAVKEKRKKSLYFTPQTTQRSTRAQTRMLSRIVDSSQNTPQTTGMSSRLKDSHISSGESHSTRATGTSSNRSIRSYSRIQKKPPNDTKSLTDSAMKRRQEAEEQRRIKLLASQEKEKRAIEKRRILIEQTVNEKKLKSQEKANRAAELRERQKQKETERLKRELEKREEWDRQREEFRKEQLRKRQEDLILKAQEIERRKQMKELQEIETKLKKQEEFERKLELEKERAREQEKMVAIIQQHNNSLQQKAVANSFIKKFESNTQLMNAKVVVTKLSPIETAKHLNSTYNKVGEEKTTEEVVQSVEQPNRTFVVKDDSKDLLSYDMTPPPKEHDYDNYDISEIQSGDDTDDEQQPRKRIPNWARGQQFIKQVHNQYDKSQKAVFRDVKIVFGSGEVLLNRFKVEFDLMFPKKSVHAKYAKRTSSAVWEEPPSRYRFDESSINQSFN